MTSTPYKAIPQDTEKKPFLLIGTFRNDKIKNEIHLSGREVISKNLTSSPSNWDNINMFLQKEKDSISCVALSLSESVLLISQCGSYREKFKRMLELIKDIPHMIFLYEDNLFGKFNIFNTRYYKKYLFYEEFFTNRELFKDLSDGYYKYSNELHDEIVNQFFLSTVIPAAFLAEESQWKRIKRYRYQYYPESLCQMSFFDFIDDEDDDELGFGRARIELEINSFIDSLRSEMALTDSERTKFMSLNAEERFMFIDDKCKNLRKKYIDKASEAEETIQRIEKLIASNEFQNILDKDENWKEREWQLFEIYLKNRRYSEDEKIKSACEVMKLNIEMLFTLKLNVCSFKYANDVVRSVREFLENENQSVVFKSYVLKDRIWASEFETFLSLFQEYLTEIRGVDISFEQRRTDIGTIYVIQSTDKNIEKSSFQQYVTEFDQFLGDCDRDIEQARRILHSYNCRESDIAGYIQKFQKNMRRLRVDCRQEFERRKLALLHSIEDEVLENEISAEALITLDGLQNKNVPTAVIGDIFHELQSAETPSTLIENLNIFKMGDAPAKIFFGSYTYNETDEQLLRYIDKLAGEKGELSNEKKELETELKILKDEKASKAEKSSAFDKIKKFLSNHASDIGDLAFKMLMKYLEGLL